MPAKKRAKKQAEISRSDWIAIGVLACSVFTVLVLLPAYIVVSDSARQEGRQIEIERGCARVIGTAVRTQDGRVLCVKNDALHWQR